MIRVKSSDQEHGNLIDSFLANPLRANLAKPGVVVDVIASLLFGTSKTRYGPMPSPESQVAIRDVIRRAVQANVPLRVLTPWGSKKSVAHHGIDVAELCGVLQVMALRDAIARVYEPGLEWNLALEDVSGAYLWAEDQDWGTIMVDSDRYVRQMTLLARALGIAKGQPGGYAEFTPESAVVSHDVFNRESELIRPVLLQYLTSFSDGRAAALKKLVSLGWHGVIPQEQVDYYSRTYEHLYPNSTPDENARRLARYFAQSWARHRLCARSTAEGWTDYIQVSFPPPVPGMPESMGARRVYYRTMPADHTRNHIPPWRAKGFLCISGGTQVEYKLTSWRDQPERLVRNDVTIEGVGGSVTVEADYVLK